MHGINEVEHDPIQFEKKAACMSAQAHDMGDQVRAPKDQETTSAGLPLPDLALLLRAARPHHVGGGRGMGRRALIYFDAESLDMRAMASCTVVMNWAGKMMVEFFSTEISAMVCRVRS